MTSGSSTMSRPCCTSPGALCFWAAAFAILYGTTLAARAIWPALSGYEDTLLLVALGGACVINFRRNRTFHCIITGPLFLVAAALVALGESGVWELDASLLWGLLFVGLGIAGLLEWRYASRPGRAT